MVLKNTLPNWSASLRLVVPTKRITECPMSKSLGISRVAQARDEPTVISSLSKVTGLSEEIVSARLQATNGSTQLRNAFNDVWPVASKLGGWTVAFAKTHGLDRELVEITGISAREVSKRLANTSSRTLLRNAFKEYWPDDSAVHVQSDDVTAIEGSDDIGIEEETTSNGSIIRPFEIGRAHV